MHGCTDAGPRRLLELNCSSSFNDEVRFLCDSVRGIQAASCEQLLSVTTLAALIRPEVRLVAADEKKIRTHGFLHDPSTLAEVLVHLAFEQRSTGSPLRFVSTNSHNGWMPSIAAAYLERTHGGGLSGLTLHDGKAEWLTTSGVRQILGRVGLSWRGSSSFDAAADAALMLFHPNARNSLWPTASAPAAKLLPVSWVGRPPPFDVCWRMGGAATNDENSLADDLSSLAGWCRTFVFHGDATMLRAENVSRVLSAARTEPGSVRLHPHCAVQIGGFAVVGSVTDNAPDDKGHASVPFGFVNKTPPAEPMYYSAACIEDMAPCNWHRDVKL